MRKLSTICVVLTFLFSFGWFFFFKPNQPNYLMHKIYSFHEVKDILEQADENTLILFDVDGTLISANDVFARGSTYMSSRWFRLKLLLKFPQLFKPSVFEDVYSRLCTGVRFTLIEPYVGNMIDELKRRGVPVLALTALPAGSFGVIPSFAGWRFNMLRDMGIEFTRDFTDMEFDDFTDSIGGQPALSRGILFTNRRSKGDVLGTFFDVAKFVPAKVVFFDDRPKHLQEVGGLCEKRGIPCNLFHYLGAERLPGVWSSERAFKQVELLINEKRWLTDGEADAIILQKGQKV